MGNWKKIFAIIWTGQFMSILSSSVVGYSIIFWLSIKTGSAETLAFACIATFLPQTLLGVVAGVYVDRWDKKWTMILADSFIALCTLALAILFWMGDAQIIHIYILLACRSLGSAFHLPAMQSSVPLLAPESELIRIAGINQIIQSVCNIAAPALGALLIGMTNMGNILLLDIAGAIAACTALLFISIPRVQKEEEAPHLIREIKEGLHTIRSKRRLGWLFFFSTAASFFIMPIAVLFPLMTLQHFKGDVFDMSLIEIAWGAGSLLGGALIGIRHYKINKVLLINLMYISIGLCFIASGLLSQELFVLFAVFTSIAGCTGAIYNATFIGVIQIHIDPKVLGRVLSLFFSLNLLPSMIGLLSTGILAEHVGLSVSFIGAGIMNCLIGICSFLIPDMKKLGKMEY